MKIKNNYRKKGGSDQSKKTPQEDEEDEQDEEEKSFDTFVTNYKKNKGRIVKRPFEFQETFSGFEEPQPVSEPVSESVSEPEPIPEKKYVSIFTDEDIKEAIRYGSKNRRMWAAKQLLKKDGIKKPSDEQIRKKYYDIMLQVTMSQNQESRISRCCFQYFSCKSR